MKSKHMFFYSREKRECGDPSRFLCINKIPVVVRLWYLGKSKTLQALILQGLGGRSGGIRTRGLLVPNQTRYQTALHLDAGADEGTRTPDLLITNRLLYQLSHIGTSATAIISKPLMFVQHEFSACFQTVYSFSFARAESIARCTISGAGAPGIFRFSTQEIMLRSSKTSCSKAGWNCFSSSSVKSSRALFSLRQ